MFCCCLLLLSSLRKSSVEIKVLFKFIPVNHTKNFSGTFWYSFPVSPKCRRSQRLAGRQSICGLEIQFSTKLGIQTPHYEIFWVKILKNKRPKTEKSLNMPSRRFFDPRYRLLSLRTWPPTCHEIRDTTAKPLQGSILAFFQSRPPGKYVRKDTCPDKIVVARSKLRNNLDAVNNK